MDENMQPIAVHNEKTEQHKRSSNNSSDTEPTTNNKQLTRDILLQKQREQQTLHYQQSQALLQKHQMEKEQLHAFQREGRLSSDGGSKLIMQMEETHQRELMELQSTHQGEQAELMDLIFESASSSNNNNRGNDRSKQQPARNVPSATKQNSWRQKIAAAAAQDEKDELEIPENSHTKRTADISEHQSKPVAREDPAPPKNTKDLWNRAAVASVAAGAMKQSNNDAAEEDHKKQQPTQHTEINSSDNNEDPKIAHKREIQAVMKDKTLDRAEKKKRLAEIKAKYAAATVPQSSSTNPAEKQPPRNSPVRVPPPPPPSKEKVQNRWNRAAASAFAAQNFNKDFEAKKQVEGSKTPISEFTRKLKLDDPGLTTIILDGRKDVSDDEWVDFFDSLEDNTHLTHLSVADCGLDDDVTTPLILALVENETLSSINLSRNRKLTNGTGKSLIKILKQSNPVLKKVNLSETTISSATVAKVQEILDDRDDTKKLEKIQAARQQKIRELLAFSASDDVNPTSERLSQRLLDIEKEHANDVGREHATSMNSHSTGSSVSEPSKYGKKQSGSSVGDTSKHGKNKPRSTLTRTNSGRSVGSNVSDRLSDSKHGSHSRSSTPTNHWKSAVRATNTARAMANMGGDITNVGKSIAEVKHQREMRGECVECGQKCFNKTLFKTIPLNIPDKVMEGRCLLCTS